FESSRCIWPGCNNFAYHLAWHLALFRLEVQDYGEVLRLYDTEIRPVETDDFRDMANAVSILWRLEQEGVNVGTRWQGLYEIALKRRTDTAYVFASLHYLLALLAAGDDAAAAELVAAMATCGSDDTEQARLAGGLGVDMAKTLLRLTVCSRGSRPHHQNDQAFTRSAFDRLVRDMHSIGGSHAQRDVFVRSLMSIAAQAGDHSAVQTVSKARHTFRLRDRYDGLIETRLHRGTLEAASDLVPQHGVH
ncbi:MAG: hypothetical protein AAFO75_11765, partial [Pseudomonadota bacterium]